jgi:hypothetical protein
MCDMGMHLYVCVCVSIEDDNEAQTKRRERALCDSLARIQRTLHSRVLLGKCV